jgi:hypothetical protein
MEWDFLRNKDSIKKIKDETMKEFFKQSSRWQKKAIKYINDPTEARRLLNEAVKKASLNRSGPLNDVWDSLQTLFSLLKDWINGEYRGIPFKALLLILAGIVYFVTPIAYSFIQPANVSFSILSLQMVYHYLVLNHLVCGLLILAVKELHG